MSLDMKVMKVSLDVFAKVPQSSLLINILKMTRTNFYPPLIEVDIETASATSNNEVR